MEGGLHLNTLFKENGHINNRSIHMLKEGSLSDVDLILISEHISSCTNCADALANSFSDSELVCAPSSFEEEILCKIKIKKEKSNQFIFYSLRVTMAASIALVFVFSNQLNFIANTKSSKLNVNPISLSSVNTLNDSLNEFSQKIINMEVFSNEKRKK